MAIRTAILGMSAPKLFVSYSWTTPDHEKWVLELATDLRESGIDVILDKWNLKEGHDAHAFMESMVTDPGIEKVILVCDKAYKEKADERKSGVGTEAQIISAEIYQKQAQDKFVAVVTERDEEGKAFIPVYYAARIYIDLSDPSTFATEFERLVRWAFDQRLFQKPPIGEKPSYLVDDNKLGLATSARFKRAVDALKNNRQHAVPAVSEYFEAFATELEKIRLDPNADPPDDAVVQSIESFLPYRNEAIELFLDLARYVDTEEAHTTLHRFFESLIRYMDHPEGITSWKDWEFDNFKFIIHELFLYAIASLVRLERFEFAAYLMENEYYVARNANYGNNVMVPFTVFRQPVRSLYRRNERLSLRRLSLPADFLEQRSKGIGVEFRDVMQADFILFMRDHIHPTDALSRWWPETLLYVGRHNNAPFEVFARSKSIRYMERAKVLLGVHSKDELFEPLEAFAKDPKKLPTWHFETINPATLLGYDELATAP